MVRYTINVRYARRVPAVDSSPLTDNRHRSLLNFYGNLCLYIYIIGVEMHGVYGIIVVYATATALLQHTILFAIPYLISY